MLHSFKYAFLCSIRNKSQLFWTLLFPIILGTFFHFGFNSIIENTENFSQIPVAIVTLTEGETSETFIEVAEQLVSGETPLLNPQFVDSQQAEKLLENEEIDGIFYIDDSIRLVVAEEGLRSSILKQISDSYLQTFSTVAAIAQTRPDLVTQVIEDINGEFQINREVILGKGETDTFLNYFYALIAMQCLFACYQGFYRVVNIQANMSSLAARRCVSPVKKMHMVLVDFIASICTQFVLLLIVLAYFVFILGINFSGQWGFVLLTSFVGCIVGVSYGTFIGSVLKSSKRTAEGLLTGLSLFLCFLSGLMLQNIKNVIENYAPIINRINPAALLTDAFYSLTVYDNYSRYMHNIISLLIIAAIFCTVSILNLRRKRYASI